MNKQTQKNESNIIHIDFKKKEIINDVIEDIIKSYKLNDKDSMLVENIATSCYSPKDARRLLISILGHQPDKIKYSEKINNFYEAFNFRKWIDLDPNDDSAGITTDTVDKIVHGIKEKEFHKKYHEM